MYDLSGIQHSPLLSGRSMLGRKVLPHVDFPLSAIPGVLLVLGPIVCRRASAIFFKKTIEIGDVVESGLIGNLADGIVCAEQQFTGVADTDIGDEFRKAFIRMFFEKMTEC